MLLSYEVFNGALYWNLFFRTILWVEKYFRHFTSFFIFVYKQTSSTIVCSDWPITVQLFSRFPAWNWTCSNWHRFLASDKSGTRKVWQTDQFLVPVEVPETGQCVIIIRPSSWIGGKDWGSEGERKELEMGEIREGRECLPRQISGQNFLWSLSYCVLILYFLVVYIGS